MTSGVESLAQPSGLARVTISTPRRRIDIAVPEQMPVAEVLPELLRHAGEALADSGERHGGWSLRRIDGTPVAATEGLHAQGIRDGDILHLVPARTSWPELEYDDVVELIAAGARRIGTGWSPALTRTVAIAAGMPLLAAGLLGRPQWPVAAGAAVLLAVAGTVAARVHRDGVTGAALGAFALPYALLAGVSLAAGAAARPAGTGGPAGWADLVAGGPWRLLAGGAALAVTAVLCAVAVRAGRPVFVAGATAGALGMLGAPLGHWLGPAGAAAVLITLLTCGIGLIPLLAIRIGRLPIPVPRAAPDPAAGQTVPDETGTAAHPPGQAWVRAAVRRTEDALTGMLAGHAVVTAVAAAVLVHGGGPAGHLLAGVAGAVLLLRARLFTTVSQRVPVLVAGLAALGMAAGAQAVRLDSTLVALVALGGLLSVLVAGAGYARRPPSPYLARTADLVDLVLVCAVVPVAAAVLGLYGRMRGLAG